MIPEPTWLSLETVHLLHAQQVDRFGGSHGVLNAGAIEAALARPKNVYLYQDDADLPHLAAVYLVGLTQAHGYVDGNKRIGAAAMLVFLAVNRSALHVPADDLYRMVMEVANGRAKEDQVAEWVRHGLSRR